TLVHNATELDHIRTDLAGAYCLANDIDMSSVANFVPIGNLDTPFTGTLDGNSHAISNLKIGTSATFQGLFGVLVGGTVKDLNLVNVTVSGPAQPDPEFTSEVGGLVGELGFEGVTATIARVSVSGNVSCAIDQCIVGGVAGYVGTSILSDLASSA